MSDLVSMLQEDKEERKEQAKAMARQNQFAAISAGIQLYSAKQLKSVSVGVHALNDKMDQTNTALSGIDRGIGRVESQLQQTSKSMADMAREAALASQRQQAAHAESMAARQRHLAVSEEQKLLQASTLDETKKQTQLMQADQKIRAEQQALDNARTEAQEQEKLITKSIKSALFQISRQRQLLGDSQEFTPLEKVFFVKQLTKLVEPITEDLFDEISDKEYLARTEDELRDDLRALTSALTSSDQADFQAISDIESVDENAQISELLYKAKEKKRAEKLLAGLESLISERNFMERVEIDDKELSRIEKRLAKFELGE